MRIPKVGESGWQAKSILGRWGGWRNVEIMSGPFYSISEIESYHGRSNFIKCDYIFPMFEIEKGRFCDMANLRRKPDNKASAYSFQQIIQHIKEGEVHG